MTTYLLSGDNISQFIQQGIQRTNVSSLIIWYLKFLGLITVFSYIVVILCTWMYANYQGYTYFSAGESIDHIKYPEWIFGINGVFVVAYYIKKELDTAI